MADVGVAGGVGAGVGVLPVTVEGDLDDLLGVVLEGDLNAGTAGNAVRGD